MPTPKMPLPERLFQVPAYLPYLQPKLTRKALADAESNLGVTLPAAYVAMLQVQNGGYLRLSQHPSGLAPVDCLRGIGSRFPSLLGHDWSEVKAHMAENRLKKPRRIDDLLPFCGDGHYFWCFDYRKNGRQAEPSISYIDVETFDIDRVVAPDFLTFLHALRAEIEITYGIVSRHAMAKVASALSEATGYPFEDQGDWANGYRVFRAQLSRDPQWAWLTPNQVKRGFVRRDERDYKTLRALMPGFTLRHPEHPDCGYFLTTDFDTKKGRTLLRALASLPYETRRVELS